jgi:Calcineurin-like phosphoesterase
MPDPAKLLHTIARAVEAIRAAPNRTGRVITLVNAADVLIGGDLHGHLGNFQALMKKADLGNHPQRHFVVQEVVHGPCCYPNGGDKSHQLLDLIAALICQFPHRVHFLPGNHELAQATGRAILKGDHVLNEQFTRGIETAYRERADEVYAAYLDLIAAAPLAIRTANRVFISHSLPSALWKDDFHYEDLLRDSRPEDLDLHGSVYALVWGRDTRPANVAAFLAKVDADLLITGHIPLDTGFTAPSDRQLILDSLGSPAAYVLFPADRPLTHSELVACAGIL